MFPSAKTPDSLSICCTAVRVEKGMLIVVVVACNVQLMAYPALRLKTEDCESLSLAKVAHLCPFPKKLVI